MRHVGDGVSLPVEVVVDTSVRHGSAQPDVVVEVVDLMVVQGHQRESIDVSRPPFRVEHRALREGLRPPPRRLGRDKEENGGRTLRAGLDFEMGYHTCDFWIRVTTTTGWKGMLKTHPTEYKEKQRFPFPVLPGG